MKSLVTLSTVLGLVLVAGCAKQGCESDVAAEPNPAGSDAGDSQYLLTEEPTGAAEVIAARKESKDKDDVIVVGRIGGSEDPWVKDRAAFTIVDNSLKACSDIPGDTCEKPWDYCCETDKLPTSSALVKVVDADGKLVKIDARKLLNVKELSTVVVKGKAQRDKAGNFTVLASAVYVKKK